MESGLILFNKDAGITSFDALREIKRALGTGKVGHTGTLDKFARGLLIVLAGKALKLSRWFTNCDKKYRGRIHFGIETDTLDPEGMVTAKAELPGCETIEQALKQFTGSIMQAPPLFSAIHVNGKRASDLARSGQDVQMKKRPVNIYKLELLSWKPPFADIFVHCSSGTYIRSLARDIALAAGSRAHLCELLRTQVAGFELSNEERYKETQTVLAADFKSREEEDKRTEKKVLPINKSVIKTLGLPWYEVSLHETDHIIHGKPLDIILKDKCPVSTDDTLLSGPYSLLPDTCLKTAAAVFCDETLVAIIEKTDGKWKYGCVM